MLSFVTNLTDSIGLNIYEHEFYYKNRSELGLKCYGS